MDYADALLAARSLASLSASTGEFNARWNALEDTLLALPGEIRNAFLALAYKEGMENNNAAMVLVTMLDD
jgi:ABC-type phosphate transport system auxiliary subunit